MGLIRASIFICLLFLMKCSCDSRRPIYIIGHMVNSIAEIKPFLDGGCNALEVDIQFFSNGSLKGAYHGSPCDYGRACDQMANVKEYMNHLRLITNPSKDSNNYGSKMAMLQLDLKLRKSINMNEAGKDLAKHVLDHLWSKEGKRKQEIRVLLCISSEVHVDVILSFIKEFGRRGQQSRLKDVGVDSGLHAYFKIKEMFQNITLQTWINDGITNRLSSVYPDTFLRKALEIRDTPPFPIAKVYQWTIDDSYRMRRSLELEVDGFITNEPTVLIQVLADFKDTYRLATPYDNPFKRYDGKRTDVF